MTQGLVHIYGHRSKTHVRESSQARDSYHIRTCGTVRAEEARKGSASMMRVP